MTSLGGYWLRFRQWSRHGLVTAYYRDVVRPSILRTDPVTDTSDLTCEIHVLTSGADWLNLIWALKSFYRTSDRRFALCIHEDGTVPPEGKQELGHHFPDARIIEKSAADRRVLDALGAFTRCADFRRTNLLAPKLFDFVSYLQSGRMLLFDSDLLFFSKPTELLRRIEDPAYTMNSVNRDVATAYSLDPSVARSSTGQDVIERFNSGLGLIHRESIRFDWIESFLEIPGILDGHFWRIEQTLYALCSSKFGCELLPGEYDVRLDRSPDDCVRHYVGAIRHRMYSEGIRRLVRAGLLDHRTN